ncbi:GNAT family N-acetyltransferase [Chryseomicrobium palamuruense]|uniref:GNAT family N-acetyltransferase n=1 Tax=Chryseomicrobium palamuruense TaxID=682973 RepID=A0ABV8UW51_9BACL
MSPSIVYRQVTDIQRLKEIVKFQEWIWSIESVTMLPHLIAAIHNGGVVIGAFDEEKLVGFCYGFAGFKESQNLLISHMMGIHPEYRNMGIGESLKISQKSWAADYGYTKIVWTYDPLESRNGYLNIHKLGGYVRTYYKEYYGEMTDEINKGMPADRFLVEWDVHGAEKELMKRTEVDLDVIDLLVDGEAVAGGLISPIGTLQELVDDYYAVAVPKDIHFIKKQSIKIAQLWRHELREAFEKAFSSGYRVVDVIRHKDDAAMNYYILQREKTSSGAHT